MSLTVDVWIAVRLPGDYEGDVYVTLRLKAAEAGTSLPTAADMTLQKPEPT